MKLKLEKDVSVAVEVDKKIFIESENGVLYQSIDDNEILLYIKSEDETKEIKIRIFKGETNSE